jgi:hypothetical protein
MRIASLIILTFLLLATNSCEKQDPLENTIQDAKIVDFDTRKLYCCWGWTIEVGETIIKSEYIPGLDPLYDLDDLNNLRESPLTGRIKIGEKYIDCGGKLPDYYEILQFDLYK